MVSAQHLHELVLDAIDILKLVDHDIFEALLPFQPDLFVLPENIQRKLDQIVVVQPKALLLLIQIAVKYDILSRNRRQILLIQHIERHRDHIEIIIRPSLELQDLYHVPRLGKCHIAQRQPSLLINNLQHRVNVGIVQHEKALGILHRMAVLLQHSDAESVEGVDISRIIVPGQVVDSLAHLVGGFICEGYAQDISRQNPDLVHQIRKAPRERPGLAGTRARNHADNSLRRRDRLPLSLVESLQNICHILTSPPLLQLFQLVVPDPHAGVARHAQISSRRNRHASDLRAVRQTGALKLL